VGNDQKRPESFSGGEGRLFGVKKDKKVGKSSSNNKKCQILNKTPYYKNGIAR
jgi:hypothetical protein